MNPRLGRLVRRVCALGVLGLSLPGAAAAQGFGDGLSIHAKVGTLGPGLELTTPLRSKLNLRVAGHYLPYTRQDVVEDLAVRVQVDSDVTINSFTALLDFFPFGTGGLKLTGGAVYNLSEGDFLVTPLESYMLNEKEFTPEKIGTMTARLSYDSKIAPYVGLGFGNPVGIGKGFGVTFEVGAAFTQPPQLELSGTRMIAPTATQAPDLQEGLDVITIYPVVAFGLGFKL